jgi:hypothetical protein
MQIVRLAGFTLAALAAVLVFVFVGPGGIDRIPAPSIEGIDESISRALAEYDQNALNAGDSAELQIVTNGWVSRELQVIVAQELNVLSQQIEVLSTQTDNIAQGTGPDDRVAALLLIGVVTLGFHAATLPYVSGSRGPTPVASRPTAVPAPPSVAPRRPTPTPQTTMTTRTTTTTTNPSSPSAPLERQSDWNKTPVTSVIGSCGRNAPPMSASQIGTPCQLPLAPTPTVRSASRC